MELKNDRKIFKNGDHKATIYLDGDCDRIGAIDYRVRIYDSERVEKDAFHPFVQKVFSVGASPKNKGKEDVIKNISENNLVNATEYFQKEVQGYLDKGFIEVPTLKQKIGQKISDMKEKFSVKDSDLPKFKK
jgi:hypothetical protein